MVSKVLKVSNAGVYSLSSQDAAHWRDQPDPSLAVKAVVVQVHAQGGANGRIG